MSSYTNSASSLRDLLSLPYHPPDQFWFLYTLFAIVFIHAAALKLGIGSSKFLVLAVGFYTTCFLFRLGPWGTLYAIRNYTMYFALGLVIAAPHIASRLRSPNTLTLACITILGHLLGLIAIYHGYDKSLALRPLWALCGTAAIIAFAVLLERFDTARFVEWWGRFSLEIYVAHVIMAAAARIVLHRALGCDQVCVHLAAGLLAGLYGPIFLVWFTRRIGFKYAFSLRPRVTHTPALPSR